MVWGERGGSPSSLSYEAFLSIAHQQGLDLNDDQHLAQLYEDVLAMLQGYAEFAALSVGSVEPADVYVAGSEAS